MASESRLNSDDYSSSYEEEIEEVIKKEPKFKRINLIQRYL